MASGPVSRPAVAIVGGGIIGLSIAFRLSRPDFGLSIDVFDQSVTGGEASWAGAGMLSIGGEIDAAAPLANLALESRKLYPAFVHELESLSELPIDYLECGALDVAYSDDELTALDRRAERQRILGIRSKGITAGQVATFWPRIRQEGLTGGRFYPDDAIVNPRELVHALKVACRKAGVNIVERCCVKAIELAENRLSVVGDRGTSHFNTAVIAAGAWSSQIELSGAPALPHAEPVKGQLIGYHQPEQTCNTIVRHGHTYLLQRSSGLLIAGSSMERVGFDRELDPFIEADIAHSAGFLMPHLAETSPCESWLGFRPSSDDLQLGMWRPGLYLAYGHFRNGILLAPATADHIANQISANLQKRSSASGADR